MLFPNITHDKKYPSHIFTILSLAGFDSLVAQSLQVIVRENLGQKTLQKVEQRLFERYGINITQSIEEFYKLDSVLREFFGDATEGLEKQFLEPIVTLEESKREEKNWITVRDSSLARLILESFGDNDKKNIINSVIDESKIISEILEQSEIPQTSGYRKINTLIQSGLLIVDGFITIHDGKTVNKYKSILQNVRINIEKNKVVVQAKLAKESMEKSSVIQVIQGTCLQQVITK